MKGILHKTEQGWIVIYDQILGDGIVKRNQNALPLHPDNVYVIDHTGYILGERQEFEFEMVNIWENGEVGVNGLTYAKLIKEEKPLIDNRKDKLETLAKLLAKTWFYCDWKWESPNERVMQMLMQDLGLYPFKDEDEMIQQTKIDDGLDKELYKEASRRIPTYGKLSEDLVESPFDFVCTTPDCPHCGEDIAQMEDDDLTDDEWLIKEKHKEIETTAIYFAKWLAKDWMSIWVVDKWLWEYQTQVDSKHPCFGYKTEEELFELYKVDRKNER